MTDKKTILVTGCSDGSLGSALALALHNLGWRVFASARNMSKMDAAKNAGIECVQLDVNSTESLAAAVEQIKQLTGGSLDGLINNAGMGYSTPIVHVDMRKAQDLFELNVFSVIRVTQVFLPLLLKSSHGAILVNNTSGAALLGCGLPFQGAYAASKAAAASLTESLRVELAPFGIKVINLVTGAIETTFFDNSPDAKLPADSIYSPAKETIESSMAGRLDKTDRGDAATWAKQVAKDISQRKPPHLVYRGPMAGMAKYVALLPIGMMDGTLKKMGGIDVLEKKIKEQRGLERMKQA